MEKHAHEEHMNMGRERRWRFEDMNEQEHNLDSQNDEHKIKPQKTKISAKVKISEKLPNEAETLRSWGSHEKWVKTQGKQT